MVGAGSLVWVAGGSTSELTVVVGAPTLDVPSGDCACHASSDAAATARTFDRSGTSVGTGSGYSDVSRPSKNGACTDRAAGSAPGQQLPARRDREHRAVARSGERDGSAAHRDLRGTCERLARATGELEGSVIAPTREATGGARDARRPCSDRDVLGQRDKIHSGRQGARSRRWTRIGAHSRTDEIGLAPAEDGAVFLARANVGAANAHARDAGEVRDSMRRRAHRKKAVGKFIRLVSEPHLNIAPPALHGLVVEERAKRSKGCVVHFR